jgi:hypothetical protein
MTPPGTDESADAGDPDRAEEVGTAGRTSPALSVGPTGEQAARLGAVGFGEPADQGGALRAVRAGEPGEDGATRAVRASWGGRRSRWSWAAVAVGLLVLAVLVPMLLHRDSNAAVEPAPEPTVTATQAQTQTPEAFPAPPPTGYALYRDRAGWSIAVPKAWQATRTGSGVTFRDGDRVLTVTHHGNPPRDPYAAQVKLEPTVKTTTAGYDLMRIARVKYRDWPTADWEYRAGAGPVMHTLVRSTIPAADTVYDISWTTLDSRWTAERKYFDNAMRTFDAGA